MGKNIDNKSNFSMIQLFSDSQDEPFVNSSAFRDYDLIISLFHYDDVTFSLKFKNQERMNKFMDALYYRGFTLTTDGLSVKFKSDTDVGKEVPKIQISGDTTTPGKLRPHDLRELYEVFIKQFRHQVKKDLVSVKDDDPVWHDDVGQTYYFI